MLVVIFPKDQAELEPNNSLCEYANKITSAKITEVKVLMVEYVQSEWNLIAAELFRWNQLFAQSRII